MKRNIKYWALLPLVAFLGSCISDDENVEVIFEQDVKKIETYVQNFPTEYMRSETVGETGIVLLFTQVVEEGELALPGDTLLVDYTGMLLDGTVFDTSIEQTAIDNGVYNETRTYEPYGIIQAYSSVIQGWHWALSRMKEGEKATALIPSAYGYGTQGQGPIPANSVLVFELEITENRPVQP
ncbi:FKBP-type peptidyl-prolyl cis-trans isomerase [Cyclobacterium qasimii]|uniref:Peptidyl-prolyl cis-trans isomerase n=1 Tax=Cyclobacterium qasimii TaxID=1350429 RepID=A0A512CAL7_9BACT|nr:FKBP-type peptidyl-prolyl cis-trans isomerase [Cyclobacterium qasimii]GEO21252.1 hypothetical protein CQA01_17860 [Cyclobacterium qasimii]